MTNETRERIKYYKDALPKMKEKLGAAIMMLVIAASVTVTATYAWMTLSTKPEATSIDTTVAANGSLEIALANGTGDAPGKSAAGDSSATPDQAITAANITWGNLINLSDESYGLNKITLRPAAKNGTTGLLNNPLYGVRYGEDGRISGMITGEDFAYTYLNSDSNKFEADFNNEHLGVRAISTIKYGSATGDLTYSSLTSSLQQIYGDAQDNYLTMTDQSDEPGITYMTALQGLMQIYAQNVLDGNPVSSLVIADKANGKDYVTPLNNMMIYFRDNVMELVADCYLHMANLLDLLHEEGTGNGELYETKEELLSAIKSGSLPTFFNEIEVNGETFKQSLIQFEDDYRHLATYTKESEAGDYSDVSETERDASLGWYAYKASRGDIITWGEVDTIINWVCDINSATLDGNKMAYLKQNVDDILKTKHHVASLNGGAIYNMEERLGKSMSPQITVGVTYLIYVELTADLQTSANESPNWEQMNSERTAIVALNRGNIKGDDALAEETYAMAIDFWLRTNAGAEEATVEVKDPVTLEDNSVEATTISSFEQAYLTLEGKVLTDIDLVQKKVKDAEGVEQPGYYATYTLDGESVQSKTLVFLRYNTYWQNIDGEDVEFETRLVEINNGKLPDDLSYNPAIEQEIVNVTGYEGVNRVWAEGEVDSYLPEGYDGSDSTTQGGGSCYIFYANSPADQDRFLELLQSMQVVFINDQGRQIGLAYMDTEHFYAENAKVTVPLVLDESTAIYIGTRNPETENEEDVYGLMALNKNEATRVTALIYLDGKKLTNDMVLASGDIEGSLNLQFGSTVVVVTDTTVATTDTDGNTISSTTTEYSFGTDSEAKKDEALMSQAAKISALVNGAFEIEQAYNPDAPFKPVLTVSIEGDLTPKNSVSARFMRAISSTQGVVLDPIELTGSDGDWSVTCKFDKPGTYVLRSVKIDGSEYTLENPVTVIVHGSTVNSISCGAIEEGNDRGTIITSENSASTSLTLGFTTSNIAPKKVSGIFRNEEGQQVNVPLYEENGSWKGTAKFSIPGTYTIEYVEVDEEIFQLNEEFHRTLEIILGVQADIQISIDSEELELLQDVNSEATATQFTWTRNVTLDVSADIYDSEGAELKGLSNAILYYGRVGGTSSTSGLDANLVWNSALGCYTGEFDVESAGTYRFSNISVGNSLIDKSVGAPNIQAMPLHDAYYDKNSTPKVIYAPKGDAAMTVDLAYSFAASKITATLVGEDGTKRTVEGVQGDTESNGYITSWSFQVPDTDAGTAINQEGRWNLTDITMYGVYYDGEAYFGNTGVTIDLTKEQISTKVINFLYVTLDVGSTRKLTNTFMVPKTVSGMKVTVADYEGKAVDGMTIDSLRVNYYLNPNSVKNGNYGYKADNLGAELVYADGKLVSGSKTEFEIGNMDFIYVGLYDTCEVTFNTKISDTICDKKIIMKYTENGSAVTESDLMNKTTGMPYYEVNWDKPEVDITNVVMLNSNKGLGSTFYLSDGSNHSAQSGVRNWISNNKKAAVMYIECDQGYIKRFYGPEATLQLSGIGSEYNEAILTVEKGVNATTAQNFTFTPSVSIDTQSIGLAEGNSWDNNLNKNEAGENKISFITITAKDNKVWKANLGTSIVINQPKIAPELNFTISGSYANAPKVDSIKTSTSGVALSQDGSNSFECTLPTVQNWTETTTSTTSTDEVTISTDSATPSEVWYEYTQVEQTGSFMGIPTYGRVTYYKGYNRTTTVKEKEDTITTTTKEYKVDEWKINSQNYSTGTKDFEVEGIWSAVGTPKLVSSTPSTEIKIITTTYTKDVLIAGPTKTKPTGKTWVTSVYEDETATDTSERNK